MLIRILLLLLLLLLLTEINGSYIDDSGGLLDYNITKTFCNRENRLMLWKN